MISFELVPEVYELAKSNLAKMGPPANIELIQGDGSEGYEGEAPFDRIMVTAAMPAISESHPLVRQLKEDGKMIAPVGDIYYQNLVLYDKKTKSSQNILPVIFVPLKGKAGFK